MGIKKQTDQAQSHNPSAAAEHLKDNSENKTLDNRPDNNSEMAYDDYSRMSSTLNVDLKGLSQYPQAQQDEYFTLGQIYQATGDDFQRIRGCRSPWKQFDNLACEFNVLSTYSTEYRARLRFEFPLEYPKVPLVATLIELQPKQEKGMEKQIMDICSTLPQIHKPESGLEMSSVQDVTDSILTALDIAAAAMESRLQGLSLAEVREQDEALMREHEKARRKHELAVSEANQAASAELLREQARWEKLKRLDANAPEPTTETKSSSERKIAAGSITFPDYIELYVPRVGEKLRYHTFLGARILAEKDYKKVMVVHPYHSHDERMENFDYVLKQIFIPIRPGEEKVMQKAMDETREVLVARKNTQHKSLLKVQLFKIEIDDSHPETPEFVISILTERSPLGAVGPMSAAMGLGSHVVTKKWANTILEAIEYLDTLHDCHPGIHTNNMITFPDPKMGYLIKLDDAYGQTLTRLLQQARDRSRGPKGTVTTTMTGWTPPEIAIDANARTSKTSIWELAIVVIRVGFIDGAYLEQFLTSPEKLKVRDDLDPAFLEFIRNAFQATPRNRPTATDLIASDFFKDGDKPIGIPTRENPSHWPYLLRSGTAASLMGSLWARKWENAALLGRGGFGEVVKARNVDDGQYYAVKSILCSTPEDLNDVWDEVKLLAPINHPGIVRYHNAWNEQIPTDDEYVEMLKAEKRAEEKAKRTGRMDRPGTTQTIPPIPQPGGKTRYVSLVANEQLDPVSTGHDFMEPSLPRRIGPEYDTEDEDSNPFGFQSPPGSDEEENEDGNEDDESDEIDSSSAAHGHTSYAAQDFQSDDRDLVLFESDELSEALVQNTDSVDETSNSDHHQRRPSMSQNVTLYIQMELCESATLADAIREGLPYRMEEVWRLFREMLEALEHIHSQGVVHRDLKPANIFIGPNKHIKIGDFGLATAGRVRNMFSANSGVPVLNAGMSSKGIGTQFYTAPELEHGGSGRYSTKADMFSLGVIFFQMCYPMDTDTERVSHLRMINDNSNFKLPALFQRDDYKRQARITTSLISHNQEDRLSAKDLLEGDYLPEIIDSLVLGRYINRIRTEEPDRHKRMMKNIFERGSQFTRAEELVFLGNRMTTRRQRRNAQIAPFINQQLKDIFERHGAIQTNRTHIFPAWKPYANVATFIEESGLLIHLSHDLTLPFAAMLATPDGDESEDLAPENELPDHSKFYSIGSVFRRPVRLGTAPVRLHEISYDHVSFSADDLSLKDAQVLKVLDEVLTQQAALKSRQIITYLNHGDLLDLVLEFCKVPKDLWDEIKGELSHLHVSIAGWSDIRSRIHDIKYRLREATLADLGKFVQVGDIATIRKLCQKTFDEEFFNRASRPLKRLEEVCQFAKILGVQTPILISPLSSQSEPLYRGSIMFQSVVVRARIIIGAGGRYDKLIEFYEQPDKPEHLKRVTRAVGFRINGNVLYDYSETFYGKRSGIKGKTNPKVGEQTVPRRLEVIITSFDQNTFSDACYSIESELIANGIKAEVAENLSSMEKLDAVYKDLDGDYWLVIIRKGGMSSRRSLKVRSPSREEAEVRPSELVAYLKGEIGEKPVGLTLEPKLKRAASARGEASNEVRVVVPQHKGKKVNRMNITDAATAATTKLAEEIGATTPTVAFAPTSDDILQAIRNTRLTDSESWRALRQTLQPSERGYLQQLQEELEQLAEQGKEAAFIVNYLTNSCILYDFGKKV